MKFSDECPVRKVGGSLPASFAYFSNAWEALNELSQRHAEDLADPLKLALSEAVDDSQQNETMAMRLLCAMTHEDFVSHLNSESDVKAFECEVQNSLLYRFYPKGTSWAEDWSFLRLNNGAFFLTKYATGGASIGGTFPSSEVRGPLIEVQETAHHFVCPIDPGAGCWPNSDGDPACNHVSQTLCVDHHTDGWWGLFDTTTYNLVSFEYFGEVEAPSLKTTSTGYLVQCKSSAQPASGDEHEHAFGTVFGTLHTDQ